MRTLVVGAGATGGYFGGRLLEAGGDVTFLVRARRATELAATGLRIRSRLGDAHIPAPPTILARDLAATPQTFDLMLVCLKAYALEEAMPSFAAAVGPQTAIVPLLNGMRHLETLDDRFGRSRVLGGTCAIAATINATGEIEHLNEFASLAFGERDGGMSPRARAIAEAVSGARFDGQLSAAILLDMWEKWVFLAALAGGTCLMRAAVGDIATAPGGSDLVLRLLDECRAVAEAEGYAPREAFLGRMRGLLTAAGSSFTASMLRDIENGAPIEADHIIGDLLRRSRSHPLPEGGGALLPIVYAHLKTYEARRARSRLQGKDGTAV